MTVAATPNPVLDEAPPRPTALSAVFRRIASEPPRSPGPPPIPSSGPQLLGFAEPVVELPPVENFLAPESEPEPPAIEPARSDAAEIAAPEPAAAPAPEPELAPPPASERAPLPQSVRARPSDLPDPPAPPAAALPQAWPQNLVGRLGRRPEPQPPPAASPRFEPLPPSPPPAAPPAARRPEPALRTPAPAPTPPSSDRAGRPSLPRNRRVYRRAALPAEIEIGGVPCTLIDVSIGGFAATGVPPLEPNALMPVSLRLTIDGIEVGTQLTARIIYVTQGRSSGRFVDLSPSQMAFLRYIVTWRGESVGAVGTTTLLDAIASGSDRGFAPSGGSRAPEEAAKSRWWTGLVGRGIKPPR
jgi:hypothetical protein